MTPHRIVRTGWRRMANEVWAAGSLGRAYVIAIHPITWQEMESKMIQPCPGQVNEKSIGSMSSLERGIIPTMRSPVAAPAVASN